MDPGLFPGDPVGRLVSISGQLMAGHRPVLHAATLGPEFFGKGPGVAHFPQQRQHLIRHPPRRHREAVETMADKLASDLKSGGMDTNVLLAVLARAGMRLTVDDDSKKEKSHG